jgi:uncharacterized protein (TIGR02757 family)
VKSSEIKNILDEAHDKYNNANFIEFDPISIPHRFTKKQDIEISAFLMATIAWGQRKSILKNGDNLMNLMDNSPFDFIIETNFKKLKSKAISSFVHRTFNGEDLLFFLISLQNIYQKQEGLENLFSHNSLSKNAIKDGIYFFRNEFLGRQKNRSFKHVSNPMENSACKRLNMFLRWMVRNDRRGVDFGLWNKLSPSKLFCPLDVHSGNVARQLGILIRKQNDWKATEELTIKLREFCAEDPVKYDFALFGIGVNKMIKN